MVHSGLQSCTLTPGSPADFRIIAAKWHGLFTLSSSEGLPVAFDFLARLHLLKASLNQTD
jgi:hypothetical protein